MIVKAYLAIGNYLFIFQKGTDGSMCFICDVLYLMWMDAERAYIKSCFSASSTAPLHPF